MKNIEMSLMGHRKLVPVGEIYYNPSTRTFDAGQMKQSRVHMPTQKQSTIMLQLAIP